MIEPEANAWVLIITALGVIVLQVATLAVQVVNSFLTYLRDKDKAERDLRLEVAIRSVKEAADEQHLVMNSRLDEYKRLIAASEFAKGMKAGEDKERLEQAEVEKKLSEDAPTQEET